MISDEERAYWHEKPSWADEFEERNQIYTGAVRGYTVMIYSEIDTDAVAETSEPQHLVWVCVSRGDVEIAETVLAGCSIEHPNMLLWTVDDHGMIDEAISQAILTELDPDIDFWANAAQAILAEGLDSRQDTDV